MILKKGFVEILFKKKEIANISLGSSVLELFTVNIWNFQGFFTKTALA